MKLKPTINGYTHHYKSKTQNLQIWNNCKMFVTEIEALTGSITKLCILSLACQGKYVALVFFAIIQIIHDVNVGNNGGYKLLPNLTKKCPAKFGL